MTWMAQQPQQQGGMQPAPTFGTAQPQQEQQQQGIGPTWDRTKFRDAWMSSGVRNVNDMNNWLKTSGWGNQVQTGGSKGDKMYLPGGDSIDAVYAAGAGGNKAGPMWTGAGNWMKSGRTPFGGGGQQGGMQQPQMGWGQGPINHPMYGGGMNMMGYGQGNYGMNQGARQQQMQQNQMFQNRRQGQMPGGINPYAQQRQQMMQRQRPIGPSFNPNQAINM